jgi:hypothetical protein
VCLEPLFARKRDDRRGEIVESSARHPLNGRHAHEIGGMKASTKPGGAIGRQHVIRADGVIARDLGRVRADENRTGGAHAGGETVVVADEVLGGGAIGELHRFLPVSRDDDTAMARERLARRPFAGICNETERATSMPETGCW